MLAFFRPLSILFLWGAAPQREETPEGCVIELVMALKESKGQKAPQREETPEGCVIELVMALKESKGRKPHSEKKHPSYVIYSGKLLN